MRIPRLRASPRHGGAERCCRYTYTRIRRGGAPSGAAGFIANNQEVKTFHYVRLFTLFNMEMSPVFPFCVPVTAGIVFVFMGNPKISTKCESPIIGGDSACPPRTAPALCDGVVVPSLELSLQWGAPKRWERKHCRSPQGVRMIDG